MRLFALFWQKLRHAPGAWLFISMTVVNAGNYAFNVVLGRWLGPAAFADVSLIVTLFLVATFVTATFQLTAARFAASSAAETPATLAWLRRLAWRAGAVALVTLVAGAPLWRTLFRSASPWPFVILGVAIPAYFVLGVERGTLQGRTQFNPLAWTFQLEMWVRLLGAVVLVGIGWQVPGAVAALSISIGAAWLLARQPQSPSAPLTPTARRAVLAFAGPIVVGLIGQVVINNSDVLLVKHWFAPDEAGRYAALALIGRMVFFATSAAAAVVFPLVARRRELGQPHQSLLWGGIGLVSAGSLAITLGCWLFPAPLITLLFGASYVSVAPLLWQYAAATSLYAVANMIITYQLAQSDGGGAWLALCAGGIQVGGIVLFHGSLAQVVAAQIAAMALLLALVVAWQVRQERRARPAAGEATAVLSLIVD